MAPSDNSSRTELVITRVSFLLVRREYLKTKLRAEYYAFITGAKSIPETLEELEVHVPA